VTQRLTFKDKFDGQQDTTTGFDYLRIGLAVFILVWHSIWLSTGSEQLDHALWSGPFRFIPAAVLPMFFALSGFLVAGSLERNKLHQFITLRLIRLIPALAVEITLSAVILGLIFTDVSRLQYLTDEHFYAYFLNIIGWIHYDLPGVFTNNIGSSTVNGQLWTIPFEMECYASLSMLVLVRIFKKRRLFLFAIIAITLALMITAQTNAPINANAHVPGRMLVLSFLTAVCFFLYRDIISYTNLLGGLSAVAAAILLEIPSTTYLAAFPIVYMTLWLGVMRPPAIPCGDLSYGLFLFHFPVEQTVMHLAPGIHQWFVLTLVSLPPTLIFAWLSWNLVEKPLLSRKKFILAKADKGWYNMSQLFLIRKNRSF